MTKYYMQYAGSEINKIVAKTGVHEEKLPVADDLADFVKEITEEEYNFLMACNGNLDRVLEICTGIVEKVSK